VEKATCIGTDETGAKINGKTHWYWPGKIRNWLSLYNHQAEGLKPLRKHFLVACLCTFSTRPLGRPFQTWIPGPSDLPGTFVQRP